MPGCFLKLSQSYDWLFVAVFYRRNWLNLEDKVW